MKMFPKLFVLVPLLTISLAAGELKLEWDDPDSFRDADRYFNGGSKSKKSVLNSLERFFTKEVKRKLPDGAILEMKVTEVDLAGDFEPWHFQSNTDIRVVKTIYPARIEFEYKYIGADGAVIAEGAEKLHDRNVPRSLQARTLGSHESYPFVKALVRSWIRDLAKS